MNQIAVTNSGFVFSGEITLQMTAGKTYVCVTMPAVFPVAGFTDGLGNLWSVVVNGAGITIYSTQCGFAGATTLPLTGYTSIVWCELSAGLYSSSITLVAGSVETPGTSGNPLSFSIPGAPSSAYQILYFVTNPNYPAYLLSAANGETLLSSKNLTYPFFNTPAILAATAAPVQSTIEFYTPNGGAGTYGAIFMTLTPSPVQQVQKVAVISLQLCFGNSCCNSNGRTYYAS